MSFVISALIVVHVIICILLVGVVMMQRPRSEGLGAAFGGGMTENMFGAQTTSILTKATVWLGSLFFIISLLLAFLIAHQGSGGSVIETQLLNTKVPAASAPAADASTEKTPEKEPENAPAQESVPSPSSTQEPINESSTE